MIRKAGLALLLMAAGPPPGALSCSGCHGAARPMGADVNTALLAFRAGTREATVMDRIARGFDEAELGAIAAWWAEAK